MQISKDSFFRVFQSDLRVGLQRFFENRRARITPEIASDFVDPATLDRLMALELVEFDGENNEYRLDNRVERFFDEMLGAAEIAPRLADVGVREPPPDDQTAEPAQPVRSGQNFCRFQRHREIPTPCSLRQAGLLLLSVVRHPVLD
jgi:hypothetical protein